VNRAHRFSQAISEGDGISVIAVVDGAAAARRAEEAGAEAVLVQTGSEQRLAEVRGATMLPVLSYFDREGAVDLGGGDACIVDARRAGDDDTWLERMLGGLGAGYELAFRIDDEEQLTWLLEELDPEIFVLAIPPDERGERELDLVLDLLPDVPAGKLAIADVPVTTRDEVVALERAGVDGVIVRAVDVAELVGAAPPAV
jgi:hypothetical protein